MYPMMYVGRTSAGLINGKVYEVWKLVDNLGFRGWYNITREDGQKTIIKSKYLKPMGEDNNGCIENSVRRST